ncbi:MAG: ATP-binding protein [Bacillota bacterium]|nr:ATP-binding protein [Bacillota bacterium]
MREAYTVGEDGGRYPAGSLRWMGTGPPLLFLVVLSLAELLVFDRYFSRNLSTLLTIALAAVGILAYGLHVSRVMERAERQILSMYREAAEQNRQLQALHEAGLAITSNLSLETVLHRVLDLGLAITGAGSGAVAVYDEDGQVERLVTRGLRSPLEASEMFALPLRYGDALVGMLYLADREGGAFGPREESAARKLSAHAAVAVMNARLLQQAERAAILEERHRLSMDLHDGVLQELYAITLRAEDALADLPAGSGALRARLEGIVEAIDRLEAGIRRTVQDLRSEPGRPVPPAQAVEQEVKALDLDGRVELETRLDPELRDLPGEQADALRFVVREALANVLRHARARRVRVELARRRQELLLEVSDDGVGFEATAAVGEGAGRTGAGASHHGLGNMRRRAERAGGSLRVESAPGRGTRVLLLLPLATPAARRR